MTQTQTWSIVGLGWLGQALANHLVAAGRPAWGTHRSDFDFTTDPLPVRPADVWLFNTPPLTTIEPARFAAKVATVFAGRVLFVSSTSVYGNAAGRVDEDSPAAPVAEGARWLRAVEADLRSRLGDRLIIVRPGGLIGGERHPVFPLSRRGRGGPDAPVNLIHREDLIEILITLGSAEHPPFLVNAVAPHHPLKSEYYGGWARRLKLAPVTFEDADPAGRIVDSIHLARLHPRWRCGRLDYL